MQTDTETLALALGEDICPITDEERVTLIRKMINMANALHTTEKSLKQRISNLKKEQYILVAIVTYHGFFSKKKKKARVMALNYKKAQEEN